MVDRKNGVACEKFYVHIKGIVSPRPGQVSVSKV